MAEALTLSSNIRLSHPHCHAIPGHFQVFGRLDELATEGLGRAMQVGERAFDAPYLVGEHSRGSARKEGTDRRSSRMCCRAPELPGPRCEGRRDRPGA